MDMDAPADDITSNFPPREGLPSTMIRVEELEAENTMLRMRLAATIDELQRSACHAAYSKVEGGATAASVTRLEYPEHQVEIIMDDGDNDDSRGGAEGAGSPLASSDDIAAEVRVLFRAYGKPWSVDEVERLLRLDEEREVRLGLYGRDSDDPGLKLDEQQMHIERTVQANQTLQTELFNVQHELAVAHRKIEELSVALESYSKYQELAHAKTMEAAASESAKQAAREIAFLCDTLSASRVEVDRLKETVSAMTIQRDRAVSAFHELQSRTEELLRGCEEMSTNAHREAQGELASTQNQVRARERDLTLLRGEILTLSRQYEEQRQLRSSLESELIECRAKLTSIKETCTTVRTDAKQLKLDKQAALAQVAQVQQQLSEKDVRIRSLEGQLSNALSQQRSTRHDASPRRTQRAVSGSRNTNQSDEPTESSGPVGVRLSPKARPGSKRAKSATPTTSSRTRSNGRKPVMGRSSVVDGGDAGLETIGEPTEESLTDLCAKVLLPLFPGVSQPRELVTSARDRILRLDADLKQRFSALQHAKKLHIAALQEISVLEKKSQTARAMEKSLEMKERQIDKLRKEIHKVRDDESKLRKQVSELSSQSNSEVEELRAELDRTLQELNEGKEVMMQLLREGIMTE